MILTIDIGNSNLVAVLFNEKKEIMGVSRVETARDDIENYYHNWLEVFIAEYGKTKITGFVVSCVVPMITETVMRIFNEMLNVKGVLLTTKTLPNFKVSVDDPTELGTDLIATAYGALGNFPPPITITDMGSANKISVIREDGVFEGVIIAPGIGVSNNAMSALITHLPQIELKVPDVLIGKDTITCMQSGLLNGVICSLEGLVTKIEEELGQPSHRLLTGGYANIVHEHMDMIFDPYLLNEGLYEIYKLVKAS